MTPPSRRVLELLHWVHGNPGTQRNPGYFVFRGLGATPVQVLETGGDCADKSRLLAALLREVDIPATVAMCFDTPSGPPTHAFVEAQTGDDTFMVADPAYDLYFPKPDAAGYYDLLDLRGDPEIVSRRIAELCRQAPPAREADLYYMRPAAPFEHASTVNWNKNAVLRFLHRRLTGWYGDELYRLRRPLPFEEPKLFVAVISLLSAGAAMLLTLPVFTVLKRLFATRV